VYAAVSFIYHHMNTFKKKNILRQSLLAALCCTCVFLYCSREHEQTPLLHARIVETSEFIEVTGLGAASSGAGTTDAEAKRNADNIAYIQAVDMLVEALQGIHVQGAMKLRDLHVNEGRLVQLIKTRLTGVRAVGSARFERQEDGSWMAARTIQYPKHGIKALSGQLASDKELRKAASGALADREPSCTGIVVDLRYEFSFTSLMTLRVLDSGGQPLFSVRSIGESAMRRSGGIPVFSTIYDAVHSDYSVGDYPLKIVPETYDKETAAVTLSEHDTERFLAVPGVNALIEQGKIAFII